MTMKKFTEKIKEIGKSLGQLLAPAAGVQGEIESGSSSYERSESMSSALGLQLVFLLIWQDERV